MVLTYTSSAAAGRCNCLLRFLACGVRGEEDAWGRKNAFAIMVGITALAITVPTMQEYCFW